MLLSEEVKIKRSTLGKGKKKILKLDGDYMPYQTIFKKHGADYSLKWGQKDKYWFWWANKEDEDTIKQKYIIPAITEIRETHKEFIQTVEDIINTIEDEKPSSIPEFNISKEEEDEIKTKLNKFKEMLVNIEDDDDFKSIMRKIIDIRAAQGQSYSMKNAVLIYFQRPGAGTVNSGKNWLKYKRLINPKAKPILVYAPKKSGAPKVQKTEDQKKEIEVEYYKSIGKGPGQKLTPGEEIRLSELKRDILFASRFKLVPVYSQHDTTWTGEGEDYISNAKEAKKDIKWYEENYIDDSVTPIYNSLYDIAVKEGIKIEIVPAEELGGARGVSMSGRIKIIQNDGNDVGITKTFAHEIAHELLHQEYLKSKGGKYGKFHIGRNMSTQTIEQQAELSAWMFMYYYGFDVKTTSLNYTVMWGGNKDNMVTVFDTISNVVNEIIYDVNKRMSGNVNEVEGGDKPFTGEKIADIIGLGAEYDKIEAKTKDEENIEQLSERIIGKLLNKNK